MNFRNLHPRPLQPPGRQEKGAPEAMDFRISNEVLSLEEKDELGV